MTLTSFFITANHCILVCQVESEYGIFTARLKTNGAFHSVCKMDGHFGHASDVRCPDNC